MACLPRHPLIGPAGKTSAISGNDAMSEKKPELIADRFAVRICPVCGTRTYSYNGVHPQCAVTHADAPRTAQLAEARRQERLLPHPR